MALSSDDVQSIIEKALPGWEVAPATPAFADAIPLPPEADVSTPSLDALRSKFGAVGGVPVMPDRSVADTVVQVRPRNGDRSGPLSATNKVVVISGRDGSIVSVQG